MSMILRSLLLGGRALAGFVSVCMMACSYEGSTTTLVTYLTGDAGPTNPESTADAGAKEAQCPDGTTPTRYALDGDGDGFGDWSRPVLRCATPIDSLAPNDCNDGNAAAWPGLGESCDSVDNDCDGAIDEGLAARLFADQDGDGHGDPNLWFDGCARPGFVADANDCNDLDPTVHADRAEACDHKDNDCDGNIDDGVLSMYYRDADGDGFGNPENSLEACAAPPGFVIEQSDCDDTRPSVSPQGVEACNGLDDDCDGNIDGFTRPCANECGSGEELCVSGLFEGCTAPALTRVEPGTERLLAAATSTPECIVVDGTLTLEDDVDLSLSDDLIVRNGGRVILGARSTILAAGAILFSGNAALEGTDATIEAASIELGAGSRWSFEGSRNRRYSGGGGSYCTNLSLTSLVGGGAGGARGGQGGRGGRCGGESTQPVSGAGGPNAADGNAGCDCPCTDALGASGASSAGDGGLPNAGGGGGGGGGRGGSGAPGFIDGVSLLGATGGLAELPGDFIKPLHGGAGGGAARANTSLAIASPITAMPIAGAPALSS